MGLGFRFLIGCLWARFFFFAPCAAGEIHSLTGASAAVCGWNRGRVFFFCSVRGGGNSLPHWRVCGCVWLKKRARFFFAPVCGKGKFTHSLAHPGARFFFLFCARRGKFTHSLARPRLCVFFVVVCAAGEIHSLTRASGGTFFCLLCARRWTLTHSLARPGVIHSLTGASGGAFFFFAPCAVGEIHSLTGASAAVCGWNRGRVFFFAPCAAGQAKKKTRGALFFLFGTRRPSKKKLFSRARRAKKKHIFLETGSGLITTRTCADCSHTM